MVLALGLAVVLALAFLPLPRLLRGPNAGPRVVASTTVLADFVRQVGNGRLASVQSVVPSGVDVEDYNPTPADLRSVSDADFFVLNGLGLDLWASKLVDSAKPGLPTVTLSQGLSDDDNPHLWLDVRYAKQYVQRIHDYLMQADPEGSATYDANTTAYQAQLDELDAWIVQQVATIPPERRKLVTFHEAYPHFAARYGFELVGVVTPSPGQEPSAGELAELVRTVKAAHVPAVFSEAQFSPRLIQTLADEAGVSKVVTDLYNDSLGDPPLDTYVAMMRYNVEHIVQALL